MAEKLDMKSMDITSENIAKIRALFPSAVTEVKGEDGKVRLAIDFDALKQELSEDLISDKAERYQMTWPDKSKAKVLASSRITATLRPDKEKSVDFDTTENLYIEGDNLDVLKLLRETYLGKIKMIYIDPPYNTGNDFVYEDDFAMSADDYAEVSGQYDEQGNRLFANTESNGRFHTDWLNMIYPRLKVARDLLTDDGVVFISIDDNELDNLLRVCNELFGERNLVAVFPWQARASMQNDTDISCNHEYVVAFAKIRRQENRRLKESNASSWYNSPSFACLPLPLNPENFENPDDDPRGPWKADPFDAPNVRPNLTYAIFNPKTGEEHWPPQGRHWRTEEKNYKKWLEDGRIVFGKNGDGRPQLKVFYEEKKDFGSVDTTWWTSDKCGTATQGTKEQMQLFDGFSPFDTPKPLKLLHQILKLVSRPSSNDIILDFFSGSATTAHAVMQLNAEDGGNRKFIMVQLPEKCDEKSEAYKAGYKTICDIGEERIRRAGKKILEGLGDRGKELEEASTLTSTSYPLTPKLDIGFRVLKLDSSNMQEVYYNPSAMTQDLLGSTVDNVKPDRTPLDLLFQVMLDLGVELSAKIEEHTVNGKTYYTVNGNDIMACFDDDIDNDVITAIAKQNPLYAVFKDKSFATDSVGINNEQLFKTYSPSTVVKVL